MTDAEPSLDKAKPATVVLPRTGEQPEQRLRSLATAQHREDRRRQRQEPDEDDRMRGGDVLERERRQQGEADHDADGDDGERDEILPLRPRLAEQEEHGHTDQGRDDRAGGRQEQRGETTDRHARRRQGAAEDDDAEKPVAPATACRLHVRLAFWVTIIGRRRWRNQQQSSTIRQNCMDMEGNTPWAASYKRRDGAGRGPAT
ncbi:hypothetical protein ACVWXN_008347 [Bradyrhizobium sp. i1.4.4]